MKMKTKNFKTTILGNGNRHLEEKLGNVSVRDVLDDLESDIFATTSDENHLYRVCITAKVEDLGAERQDEDDSDMARPLDICTVSAKKDWTDDIPLNDKPICPVPEVV